MQASAAPTMAWPDGSAGSSVGRRGRKPRSALVVEPDPAQAALIAAALSDHGCSCRHVGSAEEAIAGFESQRPDILFIAADLPGMDGLEATRELKRRSDGRFLPIMLLAHREDEDLLLSSVESGADDFLLKPLEPSLIAARIRVMEHVCELQHRVIERRQTIADMLENERVEQELAERVLNRAVTARNVVMDRLELMQRSAAIFSGDIVLTQHLPDGGLRLMVGDFTGHGLAAAVAALPIADAFHAMTIKGVSDISLLTELNRKLYQLLPAERFMAAILITVPASCTELRWWNGGMPSGWLRTANGLQELTPHALPLGILPDLSCDEVSRRVRVSQGDRLLLMTDGLLEAHNTQGEMFMHAGFVQVLESWRPGTSPLPPLLDALDAHSLGTEQADDIAIVDLPMEPTLFAQRLIASSHGPRAGWDLSIKLEGERLKTQPTLASLLAPLGLVNAVREQMVALEIIFTELYSNALEHGVLKLDSSLKATSAGFDAFYRERARRIEDVSGGWILVEIRFEPSGEGGCVRVRVCDSGEGFSHEAVRDHCRDAARPWGRGILLVRELCESLEFQGNGSQAKATYRW
ncbi:fused response regulator/phosphatase [Thiorhodococcus mannitoliphagus]|uniref:Fused response regulator/phosphatase n=1 Tax=Thiorhodococcus mannitoliphagus TaxID=329406 RepID=A0A6P1DQU7_9GAMM|nr:SpoIIE family protein phosphatase [Thiorhodococcus mannitoliphagus]NEX20637.1 fused response regulator/phosphatase [Thiorhodococcus mannitoliphagus]